MSEDLYLPTALAAVVLVLAVALVLCVVALRRTRARAEEAFAAGRAESAELRERVDSLARQVEAPVAKSRRQPDEFVITDIGQDRLDRDPSAPATRIEGRLFADIVLRESAVKAASLGAGVRRALSPETRNRIRFEMRREIKRARKQRRTDLKDFRRERAARERSEEDVA